MVSLKDVLDLDPTSVIEVPLLRPGRHLDPRKGASLLELTAAVTGDVWTDRPAGVHRTLARVARGVNDLTSDTGRPGLLALLPGLLGTYSARDKTRNNQVHAAVVATCTRERDTSRPVRNPWQAWRSARDLSRAVRDLAAAQPAGPARDGVLRELLSASIAAAHRARHDPVFVPLDTAELAGLAQLRVRTRLITEPGCDWTSLVCTPLDPDPVRLLLGTTPAT